MTPTLTKPSDSGFEVVDPKAHCEFGARLNELRSKVLTSSHQSGWRIATSAPPCEDSANSWLQAWSQSSTSQRKEPPVAGNAFELMNTAVV